MDGRWGDVYEAASRKGERESGCLGDCGHISPISHPPPTFCDIHICNLDFLGKLGPGAQFATFLGRTVGP